MDRYHSTQMSEMSKESTQLLRALKRRLTSPDVVEVLAGIELLRSLDAPEVVDALLEGVHLAKAFAADGPSEALGTVFKGVKAPKRTLARWALAWILCLGSDQGGAGTLRAGLRELRLQYEPEMAALPIPPFGRLPAIEGLWVVGLPCEDLAFLEGAVRLRSLNLEYCHALQRLDGIEACPELLILEISATTGHCALLDLEPLRGCVGLKTLHIACRTVALRSLLGLEACVELQSFTLYSCPDLTDYSPLAGLVELQDGLSVYNNAPVRDLGFVSRLQKLTQLRLKLAPGADLGPLLKLVGLKTCYLTLPASDSDTELDLSALRHVQDLDVRQPVLPGSAGVLRWTGELPAIERIYLKGPQHLDGLCAPKLRSVWIDGGRIGDFRAMPALKEMGLTTTVLSFDGAERWAFPSLDLRNCLFTCGLAPLARISGLVTLSLPANVTADQLCSLGNDHAIESLTLAPGFTGSLGFLNGWSTLRVLVLIGSGTLTDLETLLLLPALERVYLRDSAMVRAAFSTSIAEKLDYRFSHR